MGKKSRLKKERRESNHLGVVLLKDNKETPSDIKYKPVYRFFKEKKHAEDFCRGTIWLSTLNACRKYENPLQGDPGEALHSYSVDSMTGSSSDAEFVRKARLVSVHIEGHIPNITISNATEHRAIDDAFVLCTTIEFNPEKLSDTFGEYCVKISNPKEFFEKLSSSLEKIHPIKNKQMGEIIYDKREFTVHEQASGQIGFVKPKDIYSEQKEFRFLWEVQEYNAIQPFLLDCPSVATLCELIK